MKGENLRVFVGTKAIAKATSCSVSLQAQTDNSTTKDDVDLWDLIEVTGKNWSITAECEFETTDATGYTVSDVMAAFGTQVAVKFAPASGTKNRTAGAAILSGNAVITSLDITSTNRQKVTASVTFTGNGPLS